ncbi:MAG: amidohydrolase family protein, partial [Hadesarchaea archaeon]|nr:amidohydrolase family protein [Hadesarchaea archaeon]
LILSEGLSRKRLNLKQLVNTLCTNPAKIFGVYPQKGVIREGADADLVIIDRKKEWEIKPEKLHHKVNWTPYAGMKITGFPEKTISRGEVISENGEVIGESGRGKFLPTKKIES